MGTTYEAAGPEVRIKLAKSYRDRGRTWDLLAYGPNPYIAEITGFDKEYTYQRRFKGSRVGSLGLCWHVIEEWDRPLLLDIRAEMRGWYILHGTGFENLQLSEVSEGVIAQLLSEPLFSTGYMRILDDSLNTPLPKQKKRGSRLLPMFVIQSPVDTSEVPEPQLIAKPRQVSPFSAAEKNAQAEYNKYLSERIAEAKPINDWVGRMAERYKQQMIDLAKPKSKVEVDYAAIVVSTWNDDDEPPPVRKKRPEPKRSNLPAILPHDTGRKFNFED